MSYMHKFHKSSNFGCFIIFSKFNMSSFKKKLFIDAIFSTQGESLYEVLGVSKQATPEEIKKAYRKVT